MIDTEGDTMKNYTIKKVSECKTCGIITPPYDGECYWHHEKGCSECCEGCKYCVDGAEWMTMEYTQRCLNE